MKRLAYSVVGAAMAVLLAAPAMATGNGAQSGAHFNLNLRGADNCPGDDLKGTNSHVIHVKLHFSDPDPDAIFGNDPGNFTTIDKTNKIFLAQGDL